MDNSNRLFRKAVFGGFNKDDVIDYIESMKNEFFEYRRQVEETIAELNKKISELEQAANTTSDDTAALAEQEAPEVFDPVGNELKDNVNFSVGEINEATEHLKKTADQLCESLTQFMERISTSCIAVTVEAPVKNNEAVSPVKADESLELPAGKAEDEPEQPSAEEIAAAYSQAIHIKGEEIMTSAFGSGEPKAETDADTVQNPNSSFSDLLDSILSSPTPAGENSEDGQADEPEEKSILDDILSSGAFFN